MRVGILGTGRMALGLGAAWAASGLDVCLGSRDPERARDRVAPGGWTLGDMEAAAGCPVVVLATPYAATAPWVRDLATLLRGKTLVDITNPFGAAPPGRSGVSVHQEALGGPASWAAAFKTNFAATIGAPDGVARQCLIAADDAALGTTINLARRAGFEPLPCGGLAEARTLDAMVPLMIALDRAAGGGEGRSHWRFVSGA